VLKRDNLLVVAPDVDNKAIPPRSAITRSMIRKASTRPGAGGQHHVQHA
jgi:hypothetical protein